MKSLMYKIEIALLAGLVSFSNGCKKMDDSSVSINKSVSKEQSSENASHYIATSAEQIRPLLVGAKVPNVTLRELEGEEIELYSFIKEKPTVLVFYRGGWCPYCNTQLGHLKEIEQQVINAGWQIIAISPDRPEKLSETVDKHQMKYVLLSDSTMNAATQFGIAFKVDDDTIEKYNSYGIDLDDASGQSHHMLPVPAVFMVDTDGKIKFEYANPDYKIRLDTQTILSKLN